MEVRPLPSSRAVTTTLAVCAVAMLAAGAIQGVGGFGLALVAAPALLAVLPPAQAISVLTTIATLLNAWLLCRREERALVRLDEARSLALWALPGLPLGFLALQLLPTDALRAIVAVAVLGGVAAQFGAARVSLGRAPAGLLSGALTLAVGTNGPPLVIRLLGVTMTPAERRATLAALFLFLATAGVAMLAVTGELTLPASTPVLLALAIAGQRAGSLLHVRLSAEQHRVLALAILVATAVSLVAGR